MNDYSNKRIISAMSKTCFCIFGRRSLFPTLCWFQLFEYLFVFNKKQTLRRNTYILFFERTPKVNIVISKQFCSFLLQYTHMHIGNS